VRVYFSVRTSSFLPSNVISEDTQFVRAKIDSAFRLIAGTVTQLNANPINANVDSLFDMLFGRSARQTPNSDVLRRMTALGAISAFNNNDQTTPGIQPGGNGIIDVRFYCTVKRIEKVGKDIYRNKDRDIRYNPHDKMSSFAFCYDLLPPTLALTMTGFEGQFNEIQICPWFLEKSRGFKVSDLSDISHATHQPVFAALSRMALPAVSRAIYTPIDSFVLMDKVIVHELTHSDQAYLPDHYSTIDLGDKPYGEHPPFIHLQPCEI
jgi:hypothetical protein